MYELFLGTPAERNKITNMLYPLVIKLHTNLPNYGI